MPVFVDIDATDLVEYIKGLEKAPLNIQKSATDVINRIGNQLVEDVIDEISEETGLPPETIRRSIAVTRADPSSMAYRIDASSALIEAPAERPMRGRRMFAQRSSGYFHADEVVEVVTMGDEKVCQLCQDIQEEGPYRIDEARLLIPAHPHCRCLLQPTRTKRELPIAFRKGKAARAGEDVLEGLRTQLRIEIEQALRDAGL